MYQKFFVKLVHPMLDLLAITYNVVKILCTINGRPKVANGSNILLQKCAFKVFGGPKWQDSDYNITAVSSDAHQLTCSEEIHY